MSKIRLYIRSIHRAISKHWSILINLKSLFQDMFQISGKKEKINQTVKLNKALLEKKLKIINSGISSQQSNVINFIR